MRYLLPTLKNIVSLLENCELQHILVWSICFSISLFICFPVKMSILWYRRSLRLHDNPALLSAVENSIFFAAVYIFDPSGKFDLIELICINIIKGILSPTKKLVENRTINSAFWSSALKIWTKVFKKLAPSCSFSSGIQ